MYVLCWLLIGLLMGDWDQSQAQGLALYKGGKDLSSTCIFTTKNVYICNAYLQRMMHCRNYLQRTLRCRYNDAENMVADFLQRKSTLRCRQSATHIKLQNRRICQLDSGKLQRKLRCRYHLQRILCIAENKKNHI